MQIDYVDFYVGHWISLDHVVLIVITSTLKYHFPQYETVSAPYLEVFRISRHKLKGTRELQAYHTP